MLQKITSSLFVPPERNGSENSGSDFVTLISHTEIPRPYRLIGLTAVSLLSCFVLLFILLNGANVPFQDEFTFATLAQAMRLGQVSFATLWVPHNEHRILIPRIIFIISNPIVGWNSLATMVLSWGVITGSGLFLFQRLTTIFDPSKKRLWLALVGLTSLALFSPIQSENWLWGFQLSYFLVQAGVILSLFSVSLRSIPFAIRLGLASLFAAVASLSAAQGLMAWPALIITVLLTEDAKQRKLAALLVLCLVTALLYWAYFTNYKTPSAGHLTLQGILREPLAPFLYVLGLLGGPLTFWVPDNLKTRLAITFGSILLLLFGWFCCLNLAKGRRGKTAPWVGLACFVLAFCLVTAVGRAGFGIDNGVTTSRYTTHTLLFSMAVLALGYLAFDGRRRSLDSGDVLGIIILISGFWAITTGRHTTHTYFLVVAALALGYVAVDRRHRSPGSPEILGIMVLFFGMAVCILCGYRSEILRGAPEKQPRLLAKSLLPFLPYFDPKTDGMITGPFFALCPMPNFRIFDLALKPYVESGYVHTEENVKFISSSSGLKGKYSIAGNTDVPAAKVSVSGTIRCPSMLSPSLVFLKQEGQDKFMGATRLDLKEVGNQETLSQWQLDLSSQFLENGQKTLEVWVYDSRTNAFLLADRE
jgi:hypothetical protein